MSSRTTHMARSHKTRREPLHKSQDMAFHPGGLFPRYSEKNKNKNRMPSLEARFGKFKTKEQLALRIAASYRKEEENE